LLERIGDGVRVAVEGHRYHELIPEPLAGGREVEVVTRGGEAVGEGDAPAGRVTGIRPVTGLEQHRAQHPDLHHLAAHAVDLDPVAEAYAVLAHQHERHTPRRLGREDRKSTRLNSSHRTISYAVFC